MMGRLLVFAMVLTAGFCVGAKDVQSADIFQGRPARIVWAQQVIGETGDTFCTSSQFRLMGWTSEGGMEVLSDVVTNYLKPLIADGGHTIVWSDAPRNVTMVRAWTGGVTRVLSPGQAVCIWRDYVYVLVTTNQFTQHGEGVIRLHLDGGQPEVVWQQTHISRDNFMLSADGRYAGCCMPWPTPAIIDLQKKTVVATYGRGCWVNFAPDNSREIWVFRGSHREFSTYDGHLGEKADQTQRVLKVYDAPGIYSYETYHPRRSNHTNYFVCDGPFGRPNLGQGGKNVELYVGRIGGNATNVLEWWQVTTNNMQDFYPCLWVGGEDASQ